MKKDKYEELKPEAFRYEEDFTPGLFLGSLLSIILMIAVVIMFVMFGLALFASTGVVK